MKDIRTKKDKAVSVIIGYILVFSIVVTTGSTAFVLYVNNSGTNNDLAYQSSTSQVLGNLASHMVSMTNTPGSRYTVTLPMGIQGTFLSQKTPTSLTISGKSAYYNLSYQIGISLQSQGSQSTVTASYDRVVETIKLGSAYDPDGIVFDPSNGVVYVSSYKASGHHGAVIAIDGNHVKALLLPAHPYAITYDSFDKLLDLTMYNDTLGYGQLISVKPFLTSSYGTSASIVNIRTYQGDYLYDVLYDPSTNNLLVTFGTLEESWYWFYTYGGIAFFDASTLSQVRSSFSVSADLSGTIPSALTYDPANGMIYVSGGKYVWGLNSVTYSLVNLYSVPTPNGRPPSLYDPPSPWGVAFDSYNGNLYITAQTVGSLTGDGAILPSGGGYHKTFIFNGTTNQLMSTQDVVAKPTGVIYDPANRHVYVASSDDGKGIVSVFNGMNPYQAPIKEISVGKYPGVGFNSMLYNPLNHNVYVCNYGSHNISIIQGNAIVKSGWSLKGSGLPLAGNLFSSGSIVASGYTKFVSPTKFIIQDGTFFKYTSDGSIENLSALPFLVKTVQGYRSMNVVSDTITGGSNSSVVSSSPIPLTATLLKASHINLHSGELIHLVNVTDRSQIMTAKILNIYIVSFKLTVHSPFATVWGYSLYRTYLNSSISYRSFLANFTNWSFLDNEFSANLLDPNTLLLSFSGKLPMGLTSITFSSYEYSLSYNF